MSRLAKTVLKIMVKGFVFIGWIAYEVLYVSWMIVIGVVSKLAMLVAKLMKDEDGRQCISRLWDAGILLPAYVFKVTRNVSLDTFPKVKEFFDKNGIDYPKRTVGEEFELAIDDVKSYMRGES